VKTSSQKKSIPVPSRVETDCFRWNGAETLRIGLLILLAVIAWCHITGRTTEAAWQVPVEYGVKGPDADAMGAFAGIKAAEEGDFIPMLPKNITRLGAPYYGNWNDTPIIEEWLFFVTGFIAKFVGVFAAANASVMLSQVLACVGLYVAARLLGCKWQWAFAGGIAFGFAQFAFARSIHHFSVTSYWYIPLCLVIAEWMTRNEMGESRGRRYLFALVTSFIVGMQNPYYTSMFLQLVLLGAFYQYFRQGWKPVLQSFGLVGASAFGFFLMNVDTFCYRLVHGPNPGALTRQYIWLELSALKFVDLLIPPQDHSLLGGIGTAYYGEAGRSYDANFPKMVAFPGEVPPSCYLGLLGIACLVWLAVVSVRRLVGENKRNLPLEAWQVLWILAYSAVGGLNCLLGVLGFQLFRSSTRYCIFILPILLLFAIRRLSKNRLDTVTTSVLAGLCVLVALWDQTPPAMSDVQIADDARVVNSDHEFTRQIESSLPKSAMVFSLPVVEFPESPAPGVSSYDHFRPYLHSKNLRFAFGAMKGRPWLAWQQEVFKQPFPEAVHALESYGFAAVYVNRRGFQDGGERIFKAFHDSGYTKIVQSKMGDLFCVFINPSQHPVLPAGPVN